MSWRAFLLVSAISEGKEGVCVLHAIPLDVSYAWLALQLRGGNRLLCKGSDQVFIRRIRTASKLSYPPAPPLVGVPPGCEANLLGC